MGDEGMNATRIAIGLVGAISFCNTAWLFELSGRSGTTDVSTSSSTPIAWTQESFDWRIAKCVNGPGYKEDVCRNIARGECVREVSDWKSCYHLSGEPVPDFRPKMAAKSGGME